MYKLSKRANTMTQEQGIEIIKAAFEQAGCAWVTSDTVTEGAINRKETGNFRGLYWIYPETNLYFGKADSLTATLIQRHKTHRAKLDVDLAELYSTPKEKKEPKWKFPQGWKAAVRKFIIEDTGEIPSHYTKTGNGTVVPGVLDFPVKHKVDIDTLPVLVWNLDHLTPQEISSIEKIVIATLEPYANSETHKKRLKNG
jgi:hypothetical protein